MAASALLLLAYGVVLQMFYFSVPRDFTLLVAPMLGGFATYEIWAYFHGRATSVDHMIHEPRPENTLWRSTGLIGDVFFLWIALAMLYDLQ